MGTCRRRGILRWLRQPLAVLALAWLFAAGGLLQFVHQAAVRHEVCADHGELVHVTVPGDPEPAGDDDGHAHCEICPSPRATPTLCVGSPTPLAVARQVETVREEPTGARSAGQRYRLAPKTSPPSVA